MRNSIKIAELIALLPLAFPDGLRSQSPAFEVASVKPAPASRYVPPQVDPQTFRITASLADAVLWAYEVHGYQLTAGPQWVHGIYYKIEGRAVSPATKKEMRAMLKSLLADRFKLKLHRTMKEMPVYALDVGNCSGPARRYS